MTDTAHPTPGDRLTLLPLRVRWDARTDDFAWQSTDGAYRAVLPFGEAELTVEEDGEPGVRRVRVAIRIARHVRLHSADVRYRTAIGAVERCWAPHLRPGADRVIADHVFRTPALIAQSAGGGCALVADVDGFPAETKTHLDLVRNRTDRTAFLAHGLGEWKPTGHIFFRRARARQAIGAGSVLRLSHFLLALPGADAEPYGAVASFCWRRFAPTDSIRPQVVPLVDYERHAAARIFAPDLYREFDAGDTPPPGRGDDYADRHRATKAGRDVRGRDRALPGQPGAGRQGGCGSSSERSSPTRSAPGC